MTTYIVDIDNTICTQRLEGDYENALPLQKRIDKINKLFDEGHRIIYWTARGMGRYNEDATKAHEHFYEFTKQQLDKWGCRRHELRLGKPEYDVWIDDKGVDIYDFFNEKK